MNLPDYHWTNKGSPPGGSYLLGPVRSKGQYGQGMSTPTNIQAGNMGTTNTLEPANETVHQSPPGTPFRGFKDDTGLAPQQ